MSTCPIYSTESTRFREPSNNITESKIKPKHSVVKHELQRELNIKQQVKADESEFTIHPKLRHYDTLFSTWYYHSVKTSSTSKQKHSNREIYKVRYNFEGDCVWQMAWHGKAWVTGFDTYSLALTTLGNVRLHCALFARSLIHTLMGSLQVSLM